MELALFFGINSIDAAGRAPTVAGGEMAASQVPAARRGDVSLREETPQREMIAASRPLPAWLLSLMLHFALVISLSLLLRAGALTSAGEGISERGGEIVLISRAADQQTEYLSEEEVGGAEQTNSGEATPQNLSESLPDAESAPVIPGEGLPRAVASSGAGQAATSAASAAGALQRLGPSAGRSGGAATSVFGAVGEGQRFIYVFDRSSSMAGDAIRAAKRELLTSLTHLGDLHQFGIVFYNHNQTTFGGSGGSGAKMYFAKKENRVLAERFVASINAQGSTNHLPALKIALDARPDVIFFLTDADDPVLTATELQKIQSWNVGCAIHAIQFGYGPKQSFDTFLEQLTADNGGMYRYIDVTHLPKAN